MGKSGEEEDIATPETAASSTFDAEGLLEALEQAKAEAVEFQRQESGASEGMIEDLSNDVAKAKSDVDLTRQSQSKESVEISRTWSVSDASIDNRTPAASPSIAPASSP